MQHFRPYEENYKYNKQVNKMLIKLIKVQQSHEIGEKGHRLDVNKHAH